MRQNVSRAAVASAALETALTLARSGPPTVQRVEQLGQGWVAEEALAIAVYCALVAGEDFEAGVRLAVNHSGDSDSTGAITGNILGTMLGVGAIPARWLASLELRSQITEIADDIFQQYEAGAE
ncbi:MAG: ADP-ribosylglycohydrolase family protein [Gemmatimonadaceae bacterium]